MSNLTDGRIWRKFFQLKREELSIWVTRDVGGFMKKVPSGLGVIAAILVLTALVPLAVGFLLTRFIPVPYVEMFAESNYDPITDVLMLWFTTGFVFLLTGSVIFILGGCIIAGIGEFITSNWDKAKWKVTMEDTGIKDNK